MFFTIKNYGLIFMLSCELVVFDIVALVGFVGVYFFLLCKSSSMSEPVFDDIVDQVSSPSTG